MTPGYTVLRRTSSWPSRRWSTQPLERARDGLRVGVEVLVDRRADDHDDVLGAGDDGGVGRGPEQPVDGRRQHLGGARLVERQLAVVHQRDRALAHVVDQDGAALRGDAFGVRPDYRLPRTRVLADLAY